MTGKREDPEIEGCALDGESLRNLFRRPVIVGRVSEELVSVQAVGSFQSEPQSALVSPADDGEKSFESSDADNQLEVEVNHLEGPTQSFEAAEVSETSEDSNSNPAGVTSPAAESDSLSHLPRLVMLIEMPSTFDWIKSGNQFQFDLAVSPEETAAAGVVLISNLPLDVREFRPGESATETEFPTLNSAQEVYGDGWKSDSDEELYVMPATKKISKDGYESNSDMDEWYVDDSGPQIGEDGYESNSEIEDLYDDSGPQIGEDGYESNSDMDEWYVDDSGPQIGEDGYESNSEIEELYDDSEDDLENGLEAQTGSGVETSSSPLQAETTEPLREFNEIDDEDLIWEAAISSSPRYALLARTPTISSSEPKPGPSSDCQPSTSKACFESNHIAPKPSTSKVCTSENKKSEDESDTEYESDTENETDTEYDESDDEDWTDEQRECEKPPSDEFAHWTNKSWSHRTEQGQPRRESHAPRHKYKRLCLKCGAIGFHKTKRCEACSEEKEWYRWAIELDKTYTKDIKKKELKRIENMRRRGRSEAYINARVPGWVIEQRLQFAEQRLQEVVRQLRAGGHLDQANILGSNGSLRMWILRTHPSIPRGKWFSLFRLLIDYINGFRHRFP